MSKQQYLDNSTVQDFVNYLAINLNDSEKFKHAYINRRSHKQVIYKGLADALAQYVWPHLETMGAPAGQTLQSNGVALNALQKALIASVTSNNDKAVCDAACEVMRWGGVTNGNLAWLEENKTGLANTVKTVANALGKGNLEDPVLGSAHLRFNAGMTKVYSLLVDDFIIYDSRVAAALGWLVVHYCQDKKLSQVPAELNFPWASAKEAPNNTNPKNRNPGKGNDYRFSVLPSGSKHAEWNLKASWVLQAVLDKSGDNPFTHQGDIAPLRRLEAALFMIGYDLGEFNTNVSLDDTGYDAPVTRENASVNEVDTPSVNEVVNTTVVNGRAGGGNNWVPTNWVPTGCQFNPFIHAYLAFRREKTIDGRDAFIAWMQVNSQYAPATLRAYCFPFSRNEFDLFGRSIEDIERIAAGKEDGLLAALFTQTLKPFALSGEREKVCLVDVFITGRAYELFATDAERRAYIMQSGYAGTYNAAGTLMSVGRNVGKHFDLLNAKNRPTELFKRFFAGFSLEG